MEADAALAMPAVLRGPQASSAVSPVMGLPKASCDIWASLLKASAHLGGDGGACLHAGVGPEPAPVVDNIVENISAHTTTEAPAPSHTPFRDYTEHMDGDICSNPLCFQFLTELPSAPDAQPLRERAPSAMPTRRTRSSERGHQQSVCKAAARLQSGAAEQRRLPQHGRRPLRVGLAERA